DTLTATAHSVPPGEHGQRRHHRPEPDREIPVTPRLDRELRVGGVEQDEPENPEDDQPAAGGRDPRRAGPAARRLRDRSHLCRRRVDLLLSDLRLGHDALLQGLDTVLPLAWSTAP